MHATDHKREACSLPPWKHRSADRTCEHGDTRYKAGLKASARKARRAADLKETSR